MSKYILLYRGPATAPEAMDPAQRDEIMAAWNAWAGKAGSALIDFGSPFGPRTAVADDGTSPAASDQNGYTIVEAESLEAARSLTVDHPFLAEGKGRFVIDIYELMPM